MIGAARRRLTLARFRFASARCLTGMGRVRTLHCRTGAVHQRDYPVVPASEHELALAASRGERAAAEVLVDLTYKRVFALLMRMSGDRDMAAELTQETYRRAWQALSSFRHGAQFSTWLYRIATNAYLNHLRRPRLVSPLDETVVANVSDRGPAPDEAAGAAELRGLLREAVLALPEELRFTVVARYWGESSAREIAAAEGVSEVTVRKRLRRALAALRLTLKGMSP